MDKTQLKHKLSQQYNPENWKSILQYIFPNVSLFQIPQDIPISNDKVKTFRQLGNVRLNDGKSLAIFDIQLNENVNIARNRVELRNLTTKYIDQEATHGVLAVFASDLDDYRFTFTAQETEFDENMELVTKQTEPKRYTYVLGPNESCKTPADRFFKLHEQKDNIALENVIDAFSVEKLNKEFFNKYKEHYENFVQFITGKRFKKVGGKWKEVEIHEAHPYLEAVFENDNKQARDFVKKLLGRLVFIQFLQKKGWMGCSNDNSNWENGNHFFCKSLFESANQDQFHSNYLSPLFDALNTANRENDVFDLAQTRVPYLNGGLFETDSEAIREMDFPANHFENLLNFFGEYNFTIDENDPNDHEVGIDPEMLGHIFENLLEDNKDKGAFYTPKPIVQYMCQESLIQYLKTHLIDSPLERGGCEADGVLESSSEHINKVKVFEKYKELPYNPKLKDKAKKLRKAGVLSEVLFWNEVKNKNFLSLDFHRQKIIGNYIVDFYCPEINLVVEIDGDSHINKGEYDRKRDEYLKSLDLNVIHFNDLDLKKNLEGVMASLREHCGKLLNTPSLREAPLKEGNLNTSPDKSGISLSEGNVAIENFIRTFDKGDDNDPNNFIHQNAKQIEELLDAVKICDPAIGSGAFPMGLLQMIYRAKMTLDWTLDPADVKRGIIQNSIYGVDIDKGAVEIARLRFWLSLIVDENEPHPLPNLDYKIMQGNSLLESFEGIDLSQIGQGDDMTIVEPEKDLFGNIKEEQLSITQTKSGLKKEIQSLMDSYFSLTGMDEKQKVKADINAKIHEHIDFNLELQEFQLKRFISEAGNPQYLKPKAKKKVEKWQSEIDHLQEKRKSLHALQDQEEKPYFLWHLFFADVFENTPTDSVSHPSTRGELKGGFDIVIANPPYIQLQKSLEDGTNIKFGDLYKNCGYEAFKRTGDIYALFYELGINVLKQGGHLTYITSNKWMRAGYGDVLRGFFAKHNPKQLLDFGGFKVFESATVDVNIIVIEKKSPLERGGREAVGVFNLQATHFKNDFNKGDSVADYFEQNMVELSDLSDDTWFIGSKAEIAIKQKIEEIGTPLKDWDVNIYRGVLTGYNNAFIIDEAKRRELIAKDPKSAEIIKPILRGRDIKRYNYDFAGLYLIDSHNGYTDENGKRIAPIDIDNYSAIKSHLGKHWDKISVRQDKGVTPYNLRNCAYYPEFAKEKVVWTDIATTPTFSLVSPNMFFNNTVYMISGENRKYLSALLNSTIIDFIFPLIATDLGEKGNRYFKIFVDRIPIPLVTNENQHLADQIKKLVEKRLVASNNAIEIENQIDQLVYELYGLKEEEIAIVEESIQ